MPTQAKSSLQRLGAIALGRPLLAIAAAGVSSFLVFAAASATNRLPVSVPSPACEAWDGLAGAAMARIVTDRSKEATHRLDEAAFRLRRARRNCSQGWVHLACSDYEIIRSGIVTVDGRRRLTAIPACSEPALAGAVEASAAR